MRDVLTQFESRQRCSQSSVGFRVWGRCGDSRFSGLSISSTERRVLSAVALAVTAAAGAPVVLALTNVPPRAAP
jgi:hypothetical protein